MSLRVAGIESMGGATIGAGEHIPPAWVSHGVKGDNVKGGEGMKGLHEHEQHEGTSWTTWRDFDCNLVLSEGKQIGAAYFFKKKFRKRILSTHIQNHGAALDSKQLSKKTSGK